MTTQTHTPAAMPAAENDEAKHDLLEDVIRQTEANHFAQNLKLAELFAQSRRFDDAKTTAEAIVKIQAGRELGFAPFASMVGVHIIEGKPSIGAHLMAAKIKASGKYDYTLNQCDREVCELIFSRLSPTGNWVPCGPPIRTTLKEYVESGAALDKYGKLRANWHRTPDDMLFARAISKGFRRYCPDLNFGLLVYTTEEMEEAAELMAAVAPPPKPPQTNGTPQPVPAAAVAPPPAVETISEEQNAELVALVRDTGTDIGKLLGHYKIHVLSRLPANKFIEVRDRLNQRKAAKPPAADAKPAVAPTTDKTPTTAELAARKQAAHIRIDALVAELKINPDEWTARLKQLFGAIDASLLTPEQLDQLEKRLLDYKAKKTATK